jgi:hypothetical protein
MLMWLHQSFFQMAKLQDLKIAPIWGIFLVVLRDLAEKVGRVQIFGWEFLAELRQCYSLVIPTLQGYLRQFFYRNGRSALYTPARRKSREYSTWLHRISFIVLSVHMCTSSYVHSYSRILLIQKHSL